MSHPEAEYLAKYLMPLEGATITRAEIAVSAWSGAAEAWPVLHIVTKDGKRYKLDIARDEECNGPGWIAGLPMPGKEVPIVHTDASGPDLKREAAKTKRRTRR